MSQQLRVTVVYAPVPRQVREFALTLPADSTVRAAIEAGGVLGLHPEIELGARMLGIWGHKVTLGHVLRDQDRVEIWRPLRVDPKHARRERFNAQGALAAGLFARRRPGAKPGY